MSDLDIKNIGVNEGRVLNASNYDITLKRDGCFMYYIDGKLFTKRTERTDRFKHIVNSLIKANFPNFYGEMYIENGNVFDISKKVNWNKAKFMPIDLIDSKNNPKIYDYNYSERQLLMFELVKKLSNACITPLKRFDSFDEGWKYVLDNNSEGLIMRNEDNWFKIKLLKEAKVKIKEHEVGKDKGTFILDDENNNRVSGTSTQFVLQYLKIKKEGKEAIAEIEYPFITKNGNYFQPRLRQITERIYEVDK